jgi:pimeloyl-ACP methyl ester carboxylesterase
MRPSGRDRRVDVDAHTLRARVSGDHDGRPLLLINGLGAPLETLEPLLERITGRRTIVFDAPGSGRSETPDLPLTIGGHARLALRLASTLGADHFDVLGFSFGGMVAQEVAHLAPDRVNRLVLASTSCGWGGVPGTPAAMLAIATPDRFYSRPAFEAAVPQYVGGTESTNDAFLNGQAKARQNHPPSYRGYMYQVWAASAWSSRLWLPELRQPTLLLAGDADPLIPPINAQILATLIPDSQQHIVAGGGHLCLLERAVDVGPLIEDFLGSPDAAVSRRPVRMATARP